jgi:hypothetical protein
VKAARHNDFISFKELIMIIVKPLLGAALLAATLAVAHAQPGEGYQVTDATYTPVATSSVSNAGLLLTLDAATQPYVFRFDEQGLHENPYYVSNKTRDLARSLSLRLDLAAVPRS